MPNSRRHFISGAFHAAAAAGLAPIAAAQAEDAKPGESAPTTFTLRPIGSIEKRDGAVRVRLFDEYADGLLGLEGWSHVHVFYWFDKNDTPAQRRTLRVHPRGNPNNPLTGVFACRAPVRPNLIALSVCRIVSVAGNVVNLEAIDAFDGTPVLDLKPFTPADAPAQGVRIPAWAGGGKPKA